MHPLKHNGFTLIELMVTLAVAAILVTVGVPNFSQFVQRNRLASQTNRLIRAFNTARGEAITQHGYTTLCAGTVDNDQHGHCTGQWTQDGWIVFADSNGDGAFNDGDDTVLGVFSPLSGRNTIVTAANTITYNSRGLLKSGTAVALSICDSDNTFLQGVSVTVTGAASVSKTNANGQPLDCN